MPAGEATYVEFEQVGARLIARICCEKLGARESQVIESEVRAAGPRSAWKMGMDLSAVQVIASMGLGMLVSVHKLCRDNKGTMVVWGLNEELTNVLKLTQLHRVLKVADSRAAALKAIA